MLKPFVKGGFIMSQRLHKRLSKEFAEEVLDRVSVRR